MNTLFIALFLFVLGALPSVCQSEAEPREDVVFEVYLAKADPEGFAGEPATEFVTTDVPIFCVVRLASIGVATVKMELVAANVPGVRAETKVVSTSYTTREDEDRVNFSGRPHDRWVPGRYRADIYVNGVLEKRLEFLVKQAPPPASAPANRAARPRSRRGT